MSEYGLLVQAENALPEVQMADVDTIRGLKTNGDSIEIPKENFQLDKSQVGLGNVDNTSDLNKPISTDTQSALDLKESIVNVDAKDLLKADKTTTITAGAGLTGGGDLSSSKTIDVVSSTDGIQVNADNIALQTIDALNSTSATKPLSANQGKQLNDTKQNISEKGQANGYASLGSDGKVPALQLPSYVDDLIEGYYVDTTHFYYDLAHTLPITPETGKIYVSLDTNKTYRWSGSAYVYITSGAVDSVAGKTGIVTLVKADVGLGNVDNTSDLNKPVSTATTTELNKKVNNTGNETISGVKTFASSPIVPTPTNGTDVVNKDYVTSALVGNMPAATLVVNPEIAYKTRLDSDSGSVLDLTLLRKWFGEWLRTRTNYDRAYIFELGIKERTSGANKYASKFYDLMTGNYDGVQTTDATQPYTTINAAPNSRKGLKFVQGQTQTGLMDFPDKVYAAGDSWTARFTFKPNKKGTVTRLYFGTGYLSIEASQIVLHNGTDAVITATTSLECGKTYDIEFQYANGVGSCTVSDIPVVVTVATKAITFGQLSQNVSFPFDGVIYAFLLASSRVSRYDSTTIYGVLRAMFPEIDGIGIGNQFWATSNFEGTVDGAGNALAEVQGATTAGNAELIASTNFTDWTRDASVTGFGVNNFSTNAAGGCSKTTYASLNKPNRTLLIGTCDVAWALYDGATKIIDVPSGAFDFTANPTYYKYLTSIKYQLTAAGTITFTSQSNKEAGWADSTLVYNYYLNTLLKTAAQSALAASMWCHYNNDPALGAIYGKLYNWYAVHLFDLYPPCRGWRVSSSADILQLSTALGGDSVSGGKMRHVGATYWSSPNTGGTNDSGLSSLPAGLRDIDGTYKYINNYGFWWAATESNSTEANKFYIQNNLTALIRNTTPKNAALSLRLLRNAPNIATETVEKTTGYIANNIQATPLDITGMVFGTSVDSLRIFSETTMTGFQAVLYTGAGVAKETLCTGVTVTAGQPAIIPISVAQSLQLVDYTIRVSCTNKADTAGRFMVNSILKNAYTTQV